MVEYLSKKHEPSGNDDREDRLLHQLFEAAKAVIHATLPSE
ncbi:hypothetical protein [Salinicoccus albus]|nr:hypothetical protein [Salinicoccus albus]